MTAQSTNIWETRNSDPLLWIAMGSVALVVHLVVLQLSVSAYLSQIAPPPAPATETKIFAAALQVAVPDTPTPEPLKAETVSPTTAVADPVSLQPTQAAPQVLSATVAEAPVAQTVPTVAPEPAPTAKAQPEVAPSAPTPAPAPESLPPAQPGVAPVAATPAPSVAAPQAATNENAETLEVATLDAQRLVGTEPVPEPLAPVVVEPEPIQDPEPEPQPEPAPLPDLANSLPPAQNDLKEDIAGVASANASDQTGEEAQQTYQTVVEFLRNFDGGPCFAALPVLAEDGAFRFETFAQNREDLGRFRNALEVDTGSLPGTVMKPVSDAQCQALPFVTAAARYPEFQLYFDMAARDIASGDILSGSLGNTSGGFVSLLLIDDEGVVQDLGSFLKFRAGSAGFDIPMTLKGSPVETHQLLMALSTRARLKTLQALSGQPAKDFFQRLAVEIEQQGGGEDVALVAFSVR